ncbi:MAG: hypothetical protein NVS3B14_22450 [Ktedonobacteraceae bacterium]
MKILALSRSGDLTTLEEETAHQISPIAGSIDEDRNEEIWSKVLEIRRIATRPMNDHEVIAQMEEQHLDFYPFFNEETSSINVIYRLAQGGYGLLVPSLEGLTG